MIVELHRHGTMVAVLAYCPPKSVKRLAKWLEAMLLWEYDLPICYVTPIFYIVPYTCH